MAVSDNKCFRSRTVNVAINKIGRPNKRERWIESQG